MAEETIGAQLIKELTEALKNVSIGLSDVDTNTADTKEAITTLNTNFVALLGGKGTLSKLLLKEQTHTKSSKTYLKEIDNKLGGITDLIELNKESLKELRKLTPAGLSGADKPKKGSGGPASDITKGELEKLLKGGMLGKNLLTTRNVLLGGGLAALGIPQLLWKAAGVLKTILPIYLGLKFGQAYADEGIGEFGRPSIGGFDRSPGSGVLGGLGGWMTGGALDTAGMGALGYGAYKTRLGLTKGGRATGARWAKGFARTTPLAMGRSSFSSVLGPSFVKHRHIYKRLSGYTGEKMTKAGLLKFENGKITGIQDASGKWVNRTPGKAGNKAFNKTLAKGVGKAGFRTTARSIPFVGLLTELGFTAFDAHELLTDPNAYNEFKEEWDETGTLGKAGLALLNPAAAMERGSEAILTYFMASPTKAKDDAKFMDPDASEKEGYTAYHKRRLSLIKAIRTKDDGLNYPYGYPGFAPVTEQIPGLKRFMSTAELMTQTQSNLEAINSALLEASTLKLYKDTDTGEMMTWKTRRDRELAKQTKDAAATRRKELTYTSKVDVDEIQKNRLAEMWNEGIINEADIMYMTHKNKRLLALGLGYDSVVDLNKNVMVGDTLKKQTQELRTYGAGGEAGRQMQATREANTQRMIQGFLSANRKDLIMWLDRHEEINQRTQAPTSILREGDSWNVNMNNQGAGPPQE
jgi:hypothetical protein